MPDETRRYFAAYFDIVKMPDPDDLIHRPNQWQHRWQYIMVPPINVGGQHWLFTRTQNSPGHRSTWKAQAFVDPTTALIAYNDVCDWTNTHPRQPIVIELFAHELMDYVGSPSKKTPWKVIERADKVALRDFGWRVQVT